MIDDDRPSGESLFKSNHSMQESYKETEVLQHWKGSSTSTNDTYLRRRSWNINKFSVLSTIIIIIKYIPIIY